MWLFFSSTISHPLSDLYFLDWFVGAVRDDIVCVRYSLLSIECKATIIHNYHRVALRTFFFGRKCWKKEVIVSVAFGKLHGNVFDFNKCVNLFVETDNSQRNEHVCVCECRFYVPFRLIKPCSNCGILYAACVDEWCVKWGETTPSCY